MTEAQPAEPFSAMQYDVRDVVQRLDVLDDGRFAPEARRLRKGRLGAWDGALAFQGIEERCLLPADVAAGAGMQVQLEAEARPKNVPAQIAAGARLDNGLL